LRIVCLGAGVLSTVIVAATVGLGLLRWREWRASEERRSSEVTLQRLSALRGIVDDFTRNRWTLPDSRETSRGVTPKQLVDALVNQRKAVLGGGDVGHSPCRLDSYMIWDQLDQLGVDGWGRAIAYHCPGPVHKHGWDLYSFGPNGIDEQGVGDDILVGEDVADVTSRK
jgi:hypothetical protein